jgi:tRNA (cytidine/uridine-2'-O-)-methyltransferase
VENNLSIVFFEPEIPGNTGSIGRTCVALNLRLILIKPYGFDIDEKAVRRAGLDYWKHVNLTEYDSFQDFLKGEKVKEEQLFFFENDGKDNYFNADFKTDSYLIFGAETKGLSKEIYENYHHRMYYLPMNSEHIRSLNLSNVATTVAYEAIRKVNFS